MIADSTVDDRWFNRCRWNTLPLFFTCPFEAVEGYLDLHDECHGADKCWLHTWNGNRPCSRSQSHRRWRMPILLKHSTKRGFGALHSWRRSSWLRMVARASLSMRPSIVEALWKPDLQGNWIEGYLQYNTITPRLWPSTLKMWYYHVPHMTTFLILLYATALELFLWVLAQKIRQYTHLDLVCSLCFGQVSHPSDNLVVVVIKHLEEPHDQPRCNGRQHLEVHICRYLCSHPRRRVRWLRRPRECALCAVFTPPHSLLAFLLAAL